MAPKIFKNAMASIKSKLSLSDSPIRTVEQRLAVTDACFGFLGLAAHQPDWRPGPVGLSTGLLLLVSFCADVRKTLQMLDHKEGKGIQELVEAFVFLATQSVCIYRIYNILRYRKRHRAIIDKLTLEFSEWLTTDESRETMAKTTRLGRMLFWGDLLIMVATAVSFLPHSLKNHSTPTQASGFRLPAVDNQQTPYYEILFFLQGWIILTQITMAFACNNMFCTLAVMVCGHLECLALMVPLAGEQTEEALPMSTFITKHNQIYGSVRELSELYGSVLGLQPLYTGIVIITSTLLYDGSPKSNLFLQISFDHIVEIYLYCYVGDLVAQKSAALGDRLYFSEWYSSSESSKKVLLQVMHRCQKPFTLDAGIFGPLTMEMYSKCMQMTYSMWTVFKGRAAKV